MRLFLIASAIAALALTPHVRAGAQAADCDRECLSGLVTRYLAALAAGDPTAVPLAATVRFTEDGVVLPVGEGLWKGRVRLRPYRLDFIDPQTGTAAIHAVLEQNDAPILFAARLKVANTRITEIETLVVRSQSEAMLFAPANLQAPSAEMTYMPQPAERMPRDQMIATAGRYPAGLRAGSFITAGVPFAPKAYRFENGVRMAGPGCTFQPPGCEDMRTQRIPTLPDVKQRLVAVDEEMGAVVFRLAFGRGSLVGPAFEGKELVTFEAFKVYGGAIHAAEAIFKAAPLNAPSGWD